MAATRVLLAGGGHAHLQVLRRLARRPDPTLELTLVSPQPKVIYSGMLPGLIAGHYTDDDATVDLAAVSERAEATYRRSALRDIDLEDKMAVFEDGTREAFDVFSLDVGALPDLGAPGARANTAAVRPPHSLLAAWRAIQADAESGAVRTIAVVGGGAAGVELLLAMQFALSARLKDHAPRFVLVSDQPHLLPWHAEDARKRIGRVLVSRGVVLHLGVPASAFEPGVIVMANGSRIAVDRILLSTTPVAPPWLLQTDLACDDSGFVRVNRYLQSVSHPFVFAAGDCAAPIVASIRKGGVHAVREGVSLEANLRRYARGRPLRSYRSRRNALSLISTGDRNAVASWSWFAAEGPWAWRWKDSVDRRYVGRFHGPAFTRKPPGESAS